MPKTHRFPTAFDGTGVRQLTSGRAAIGWALRALGLAPGDEVLVPAFNCPAVVEPIEWIGARPIFYRVDHSLSIDLADVARRANSRSRALLVIHYFGFPQDMDAIVQLARELDLVVIEDCAHSMFSTMNDATVGSRGDFAIGSAMKVFASPDGGYVISRRGPLPHPEMGSVGFELRSFLDAVEMATNFGRLSVLRPLIRLKDSLKSALGQGKGLSTPSAFVVPGSSGGSASFEPDWVDVRMSTASRLLSRLASRRRIVERRRRHYLTLHNALRTLPGSAPVFQTLPDGVVPYAYPLVVDDSEAVFSRLKNARVPMFRWEEANIDACATSAFYSRHLLQFPCHQELTDAEVFWMGNQIRDALAPKHVGTEDTDSSSID
jgi:perosamine synthetase